MLFGNPEKAGPQISPDGKRMAYVAPVNNVLNVWVGSDREGRLQARHERHGPRHPVYFFAKDNKHLLYVQDKGGDENWRIYAVNLETGDIRDLTPFEGVQAQIVDVNKDHPGEILIALNKDDARFHDVYRLTLWTAGSSSRSRRTRATSSSGSPTPTSRCAAPSRRTRTGASTSWSVRPPRASGRRSSRGGSEDNLNSGPVSFTKDGKSMYLLDSRGANAARLVKLDLATATIRGDRGRPSTT